MSTLSNDITRLNLWGQTDAEIAEVLSAVTHGPIAVGSLRLWLRTNELLARNPLTGTLNGSLVPLLAVGSPFYAGLLDLIEHIFDDQMATIATQEPLWARKAATLLAGLLQAGVVTIDQAAAFYELDGGLLHPNGVTVEQVAAARAELDAVAVRRELEQYFVTNYHNTIIDMIQADTLTTTAEIDAAIAAIAGGQ